MREVVETATGISTPSCADRHITLTLTYLLSPLIHLVGHCFSLSVLWRPITLWSRG